MPRAAARSAGRRPVACDGRALWRRDAVGRGERRAQPSPGEDPETFARGLDARPAYSPESTACAAPRAASALSVARAAAAARSHCATVYFANVVRT